MTAPPTRRTRVLVFGHLTTVDVLADSGDWLLVQTVHDDGSYGPAYTVPSADEAAPYAPARHRPSPAPSAPLNDRRGIT